MMIIFGFSVFGILLKWNDIKKYKTLGTMSHIARQEYNSFYNINFSIIITFWNITRISFPSIKNSFLISRVNRPYCYKHSWNLQERWLSKFVIMQMLMQQMTLMIPVVALLRRVRMTDEKINPEIISRNACNIRWIKKSV